jgi:hypothetical protein
MTNRVRLSNTKQCPTVEVSRFASLTGGRRSTSSGMTYRPAGLGQTRWTAKPLWSRQRRLQGPQKVIPIDPDQAPRVARLHVHPMDGDTLYI